jgi:16S rRNA (guanine527-N7)-methyltransferase
MSPAEKTLRLGAAALGLALDDMAVERLLKYQALLFKWNRTYNLTAIREADAMLVQHLLDSLAVLPLLPQGVQTLADIGSGGGLPGIPLAIARSGLQVTLVESSQKKSAFQQQAKIDLGLTGVSIYSGRVEDYKPRESFDAAISRAFSELAEFVRLAGDLVKPNGRLYAMKGVFPEAEVAALPAGWKLVESNSLVVPGMDAQRHLLTLERV